MLCVTLKALTRICTGVSGGIARLWIFDPADFDFTQGAASSGTLPAYSMVALTTVVSPAVNTGKMFPIVFVDKSAKYSYKQTRKGCSVKYAHSFEFALADIGQVITNWNEIVDAAGCCCGLGVMIQLYSGRILVGGEKIVNGDEIEVPMKIAQDGSSGDSGQQLDDENQQATVLTGDFSRGLYEYTGGAASIVALQ